MLGRFSNKNGFGLIEVLVTTSIVGITMFAAAQLFQNVLRVQHLAESNAGILETMDEIKGIARNRNQCSCNLPNFIFDTLPVDVTEVVDLTNFEMHADDSACGGGGNSGVVEGESIRNSLSTIVQSIKLTDFVAQGPNSYHVNLRLKFDREAQSSMAFHDEKLVGLELTTVTVGSTEVLDTCELIAGGGEGPPPFDFDVGQIMNIPQTGINFPSDPSWESSCPVNTALIGVQWTFVGALNVVSRLGIICAGEDHTGSPAQAYKGRAYGDIEGTGAVNDTVCPPGKFVHRIIQHMGLSDSVSVARGYQIFCRKPDWSEPQTLGLIGVTATSHNKSCSPNFFFVSLGGTFDHTHGPRGLQGNCMAAVTE